MKFTLSKITGTIGLAALLFVASLAVATPAQAQMSGDTWKSIAIIGGTTAAGAIIGHKVAGRTGMMVGAAAGATAGYAIDRRRRNNSYYNSGYYGSPNGGYYGNGYPYNGYAQQNSNPQYQYQDNRGYARQSRRR